MNKPELPAVPCPAPGEHSCQNRLQCFEPCGALGHDVSHAKPGDPALAAQINEALKPTQTEAPSEREMFETAWAEKHEGRKPETWAEAMPDNVLGPEYQDMYVIGIAQESWEMWQARAALATQQGSENPRHVQGEPVAWRVLLPGGKWALFDNEKFARLVAESNNLEIQSLLPPAPGQVERDREDAELFWWLIANSATYTSPNVPIQLIVQEHAEVHRTHGAEGYRKGLREAIRAARSSEGGGNA